MKDLNPFLIVQMSGDDADGVPERLHPVVLSLSFCLLAVASAIGVAAIEGSLGSPSDFQVVADVSRVVGVSTEPGSTEFTLLRDVPTWILAGIIFLTVGLIWRQWQLLRRCLTELEANGVIRERSNPQFSWFHRLLGYQRASTYIGPGGATRNGGMTRLLERMNGRLARAGRLLPILFFLLTSVVLSLILVSSYNRFGVFRQWNVEESGLSDSEFAKSAYEHWWASDEHLFGWLVYLVIATVGIFTILLENVVGLVAVYVIGGFRLFCEFDVDWYDRDGHFGWRILGRIFRTVRWSLVMHGLALTILFAMVGAQVWTYAVPLLLLWLCVFPVYLGIPWIVMRSVGSDVKRKALVEAVAQQGANNVAHASTVVPYIRHAWVKPLRMSRLGVYAFFASVLLPIALTIVQIVGTTH